MSEQTLVERLRKPITEAEPTFMAALFRANSERAEAATELERLQSENERLKADRDAMQRFAGDLADRCVVSNGYGVPGSDWTECLICGLGGAPGHAIAHRPECIVERGKELSKEAYDELVELEQRAESAEAERDQALEDAKRYRFLRDVYSAHNYRIFISPQGALREQLVDAAMKEHAARLLSEKQ